MTVLDLQVAASADDAYQATDNSVNIDATSYVNDAVTEHSGLRFVGTIPAGVTVDVARLGIPIYTSGSDEPQHQLRGQAAAAPVAFTTASNNIDSRSRTTAVHQWNSTNLGASEGQLWEWGATVAGAGNGANIGSIIQENVDALGELTALVFIYEQHTSSDAFRDLGNYTWNFSYFATLHIEYTAGGGATISLSGGGIPSGILSLLIHDNYPGGITPAGIATKNISSIFGGNNISSGNLLKDALINFSGNAASSGSLIDKIKAILSGSAGSSGNILKKIAFGLSGVSTQAGNVIWTCFNNLDGGITFIGDAIKNIAHSFSGSIISSGNLFKKTEKLLAGLIDGASGVATRKTKKFVIGILSPAGSIAKKIGRIFSGVIVPSGGIWNFYDWGEIMNYYASNYPTKTIYRFQAKMRANLNQAEARLIKVSDGSIVPGSILNTLSSSYIVLVSNSLTLEDGENYRIQIGSNGEGQFKYAKIRAS